MVTRSEFVFFTIYTQIRCIFIFFSRILYIFSLVAICEENYSMDRSAYEIIGFFGNSTQIPSHKFNVCSSFLNFHLFNSVLVSEQKQKVDKTCPWSCQNMDFGRYLAARCIIFADYAGKLGFGVSSSCSISIHNCACFVLGVGCATVSRENVRNGRFGWLK